MNNVNLKKKLNNKEFLYSEYIKKEKSSRKIACELDTDQKTVLKYLHKHNIEIRTNSNKKKLKGKRFGKLKVIEKIGKGYDHCFWWKCLCDCGNEEDVSSYKLTNGLKLMCKKCVIKKNALLKYKGFAEMSGKTVSRIKRTARQRNHEYDVSKKYLYDLYIKQNKKCALSKLSIVIGNKPGDEKKEITASLDRIDSSKGYIKGNVQWVHKNINRMKSDFDQKYFVDICKMISDNN
jgi:hypothetical protein